MRIGYGGYSKSFLVPGDRRRFVKYANEKGIEFEYANPKKNYDLVYLTYNSDISKWLEIKKTKGKKIKIIFELIDSYLAEPNGLKQKLRGVFRFFRGNESYLTSNFQNELREMCKVADCIVCSTNEQKEVISKFNNNIHISLDIFEGDITSTKSNYPKNKVLKIVWEGQPYTINNLLLLREVFNDLSDIIELNLITDLHYFKYFKTYIKKPTQDILKTINCKKNFYSWEKDTFSERIIDCDLAIIPIDLSQNMQKGKPENKLVLLWKLGMPVLTSESPAYKRAMKNSDLKFCVANNPSAWKEKLLWYYGLSESQRNSIAEKCKNNVRKSYNKNLMLSNWDLIFESIGVDPLKQPFKIICK